MKKSAIALTCVLCTLMLIATIFSVSVNAVNAATTEVMLTVEETTVPEPTISEPVTQPSSIAKATLDETPKSNDSKSVQTGNTVCIIAGIVMLMSGIVTVCLERKRKR